MAHGNTTIKRMTKRTHAQLCESPDGRKAEVVFMDNGTIHVVLPAGTAWSILTHFSGPSGTRLRLAPISAAEGGADDEVGSP
ncbi:hypothetical protein GCM10023145_16590 [Angustibacter luteus]